MTETIELVVVEDPSVAAERIAVAGFLAGYRGNTRRSNATDLRLFAAWCRDGSPTLITVRRAHLELFARWMEETGRMRSTVGRRLSTLAWFYRYCEQEQLIDRILRPTCVGTRSITSPAPWGWTATSSAASWSRPGWVRPGITPRASLLALNGLRISEALGADIDDLDFDRGHRTLRIVRKGGKQAVVPLAPRTSRALYLYPGRTHQRTRLRGCPRRADGSLRRGSHGQATGPAGRDHQADLAAQPAPLVHHRRPRRRGRPPRRAGGGQPRRHRPPTRYDRARRSLDRHATYVVAAFVAGAAR